MTRARLSRAFSLRVPSCRPQTSDRDPRALAAPARGCWRDPDRRATGLFGDPAGPLTEPGWASVELLDRRGGSPRLPGGRSAVALRTPRCPMRRCMDSLRRRPPWRMSQPTGLRFGCRWCMPRPRMDGTQAHGLPARPRNARRLSGLLGWSGSTSATSSSPDRQPTGGVAYCVACGPNNGPIPAVLSVTVVR